MDCLDRMKSRRMVCILIVSLFLTQSMFLFIQDTKAIPINGSLIYNKNGHTAIVNVTLGDYEVAVWHSGFYYGPLDTMVRAPNGDLLIFTRYAHSHVYPGDYGWILMERSTDNGTTFNYIGPPLFAANPAYGLDGRNQISGVSETGRIFVVWWELDMLPAHYPLFPACPNGLTGQIAYKYSDDSGVTWSTEKAINFGNIADRTKLQYLNSYNRSCPYGQISSFQNGRVGFSFMVINDTWGQNKSMAAFAYSDDNGLTWNATGMTEISNYPTPGHSEGTATYVGNGQIISVVRTDNGPPFMYSSSDNGLNWTNRGQRRQPGLSPGQQGYVTFALKDDIGEKWVGLFAIYDTYFFTIAPAIDLLQSDLGLSLTHGIQAFAVPLQYYPSGKTTGWGISQTFVWNESTGTGKIISSNGTQGIPNMISSVWIQNVTVTIHSIPSVSASMNMAGLLWLLVIFLPGMVMARIIPKIGFTFGLLCMLIPLGFMEPGFAPTMIIGFISIAVLFYRGG